MSRRFDLGVYLITDPVLCGPRGVVRVVEEAIAGGVTLVQLRDPDAKTGALVELARALAALLRPAGIPFIVNDRVDVALAVGADGVHVGQRDMCPSDVRRLIGPDAILGLSVTSPAQLASSDLTGVDYLGVGPICATRTKKDAATPIGVAGLRSVAALTALPIVAIGGIHAGNAEEIIEAGAEGVAVVSAICAAPEPRTATDALRQIVASARDARAGRVREP
jgi:thiamine-phosphate pyrophosphorylase